MEGADRAACIAGGEKSQQAIVQKWLLDGKILAGFIKLSLRAVYTLVLLICQIPKLL